VRVERRGIPLRAELMAWSAEWMVRKAKWWQSEGGEEWVPLWAELMAWCAEWRARSEGGEERYTSEGRVDGVECGVDGEEGEVVARSEGGEV